MICTLTQKAIIAPWLRQSWLIVKNHWLNNAAQINFFLRKKFWLKRDILGDSVEFIYLNWHTWFCVFSGLILSNHIIYKSSTQTTRLPKRPPRNLRSNSRKLLLIHSQQWLDPYSLVFLYGWNSLFLLLLFRKSGL